MNVYLWVKLVHIVGATILLGTGLGIAFFMLRAFQSGSREAMAVTTRNVVLADWIFTAPAVAVQLLSGLWLTRQVGIPFDSAWFIWVISLYVLVGACWIPVVWIQIRIRRIVEDGGRRVDYRRLMAVWVALGVAAFTSILLLLFLMVSRVGVGHQVFA